MRDPEHAEPMGFRYDLFRHARTDRVFDQL